MSVQVKVTVSSPDDKPTNSTNNAIPEQHYLSGSAENPMNLDDPIARNGHQLAQPSTSGGKDTLAVPGLYRTVSFSSSESPESSLTNKRRHVSVHAPEPAYTELSIDSARSMATTGEEKAQFEKSSSGIEETRQMWRRRLSTSVLVLLWLVFTVFLMTKSEHVNDMHQISIPGGVARSFPIRESPQRDEVGVVLTGALLPRYYANLSSRRLAVWLEQVYDPPASLPDASEEEMAQQVSEMWTIPLVPEDMLEVVPELEQSTVFRLHQFERGPSKGRLRIRLKTNLNASFPVAVGYDASPIDQDDGIVYALLVLAGLYMLIIFEIVHRTLAAMLASTMSVAILAALNERPTMAELVSWIDVETLLLLFSMMVLVAILSETGIFDYLAVVAYRMTGGRVWPLINTLCIFTALLSAFLDNVTVSLLMTPVSIRLCEVMELNPVPILMAMVIYSNIGGTATAVGDPPNVIIASNKEIRDAGIDFTTYTLHMSIGVLFVMIVVHVQLRFIYRNITDLRIPEPQDVTEMRHELKIWQRAAASVSSYSKDEDSVRETLLERVRRLSGELRMKVLSGSVAQETYITTLEALQKKYPIRDRWLLAKCGVTLVFVITLFFIHSVPGVSLSLGWTALLGALLLLVLADNEDLEGVLARVEWSTLLFFAALFILMEALSRLGLIAWIGRQTEALVLSVPDEGSRLAVAVILILWVSAIASAFVDNIPLTTMMIRVVTSLCGSVELHLPLPPLVWALAFGACLGGNGTLIGASANVVCAGVAEQHGYRFTFLQFFRVGFPVMVVSVLTATCYLLVAHVCLEWN